MWQLPSAQETGVRAVKPGLAGQIGTVHEVMLSSGIQRMLWQQTQGPANSPTVPEQGLTAHCHNACLRSEVHLPH